MPTLPTSAIDLSAGVSFVSQPSRTWYINKETNRIQGNVTAGILSGRLWRSFSMWSGSAGRFIPPTPGCSGMGSSGRTRGMWPRNFSGVSPRR